MAIHVPSASHPISHGKKENPFPDDFQTKGGDLSTLEDLAIGLMNLVSLEEHFYFSFAKTKETKYLDYMQEIRGMRQETMKMVVKNPQGEEWCASKHLLAASMRLYEVGTKLHSRDQEKEALPFFTHAFELLSLFFVLNIPMEKKEKGRPILAPVSSIPDPPTTMQKATALFTKLVDCCKE